MSEIINEYILFMCIIYAYVCTPIFHHFDILINIFNTNFKYLYITEDSELTKKYY
jgi:hypothetical protein